MALIRRFGKHRRHNVIVCTTFGGLGGAGGLEALEVGGCLVAGTLEAGDEALDAEESGGIAVEGVAQFGVRARVRTNEAPPQTDEMYFRRVSGSRIIREMAPVDGGELQAVPADDLGRRSGGRSRRTGVVPEPK